MPTVKAHKETPVVKIRTNRQVSIPKVIFDDLNLQEGDFVAVKKLNGGVFFKPKKLIDADIEEALRDIDAGRVIGPFKTAKEAIKALRTTKV
jgi:AbrB family looped-hinge helix DNA binding protein